MKTSLNYTSFTSQKVRQEILAAMLLVLQTGELVRLKNRKGEPWLAVVINRDDLGYKFAFIDTAGYDQRDNVRRAAINEWPDADGNEFWGYMSASFDLTEHPAKTHKESQGESALEPVQPVVVLGDSITRDQPLKDGWSPQDIRALVSGATHKVHSWGGTVLYGAYQRDWLFRKRLYILRVD